MERSRAVGNDDYHVRRDVVSGLCMFGLERVVERMRTGVLETACDQGQRGDRDQPGCPREALSSLGPGVSSQPLLQSPAETGGNFQHALIAIERNYIPHAFQD